MAHDYRADKHNKSKKEIPSYLKYDNSLLGKIKRLFKRNKYSGTIEQEERLNRKKYSKSTPTKKPKFSINFDSEFDLPSLLQVVIPCVLLIAIGILFEERNVNFLFNVKFHTTESTNEIR